MEPISESRAFRVNGYVAVLVFLVVFGIAALLFRYLVTTEDPFYLWFFIPALAILTLIGLGFLVVQPNEARVLVLFGRYIGSVRDSGFWWANPLAAKRHVSLRIRNFNSQTIKVNDLNGNPIEIAAVVVWRVVDSARALFDVENYEEFVAIQSETAIRALASEYPYDAHDERRDSLRGSPQEVAESLQKQVQARLEVAGVLINESRISHLAYAQEIAQAMLRRQQAEAVVAARRKIVEGAVGMVEHALQSLSEKRIIDLDDEKKATMVNNLMVALVSEREAQPVINTGTLY
jgi:regulator of protease activity HflC (stomatin/prohibitin superfamily)